MPARHGFDVRLTTADGQPFTEFGHQLVNGLGTKSRIVSTKVRARDGQKFRIHINLEHPFPYPDDQRWSLDSPSDRHGGGDDMKGRRQIGHRYNLREPTKPTTDVAKKSESPSAGGTGTKRPVLLVAWVYIDGRKVPECSQVLHIDPVLAAAAAQVNGYTMRGRFCMPTKAATSAGPGGGQAPLDVHEWVFTPVGIDVLIAKMDLSARAPPVLQSAEEADLDEITTALADDQLTTSAQSKPGQIEVRITRIVDLGEYQSKRGRSAWSRAGTRPDDHDATSDGTHHIEVESESHELHINMRAWRPYRQDEEFYAKFIFNYMGLEKLVNLGLCTPDGQPLFPGPSRPAPAHAPAEPRLTRAKRVQTLEQLKEAEAALSKELWSDSEAASSDESLSSDSAGSTGAGDEARPRKRRGAIEKSAPRGLRRSQRIAGDRTTIDRITVDPTKLLADQPTVGTEMMVQESAKKTTEPMDRDEVERDVEEDSSRALLPIDEE